MDHLQMMINSDKPWDVMGVSNLETAPFIVVSVLFENYLCKCLRIRFANLGFRWCDDQSPSQSLLQHAHCADPFPQLHSCRCPRAGTNHWQIHLGKSDRSFVRQVAGTLCGASEHTFQDPAPQLVLKGYPDCGV